MSDVAIHLIFQSSYDDNIWWVANARGSSTDVREENFSDENHTGIQIKNLA